MNTELFPFQPYAIYKFKPGDIAYLWCLYKSVPVEVYSAYTSDKYNHCAAPHRRYVCVFIDDSKLCDVSEGELSKEPYIPEDEDYGEHNEI